MRAREAPNRWLLAGAVLSAGAGVLHLAIIAGGPQWYRVFGAGEEMAWAAERGSPVPSLWAVAIAGVLFAWAAYALSGAGLIGRLPLLRTGLMAISLVYLGRGLVLPLALAWGGGRSDAFWWWSSLIVLGFGVIHAVGTWTAWPALSRRGDRATASAAGS